MLKVSDSQIREMSPYYLWSIILLFFLISGCATTTPSEKPVFFGEIRKSSCKDDINQIKACDPKNNNNCFYTSICDHIVRLDKDGEIVRTSKSYEKVTLANFPDRVIEGYETKLKKKKARSNINDMLEKAKKLATHFNTEKIELLIFIHGRLNDHEDSDKRVRETASEIMKDKKYPIFISWQPDMLDTYRDHVLNIRQGHKAEDFISKTIIPLPAIVSDLLRSIGSYPKNLYYQVVHEFWERNATLTSSISPTSYWKRSLSNYNKLCQRSMIPYCGNSEKEKKPERRCCRNKIKIKPAEGI